MNIGKGLLYLLFFVLTTLVSQAQNVLSPEIKPFSKLSVFGSFDVVLEPANKDSLSLESEDVDLSKISIDNSGDFLRIVATKNLFSKEHKVKVFVYYKQLSFIRANGGAKISSERSVEKQNLKVVARNGANMNYPVSVENLMVIVGQGATVSLEGSCGNLVVKANNGGLFNAYGLKCTKVAAYARTGGLVKLTAVKQLDAHVSLNGQISYRGNPEDLKVNQIFGGSVEKMIE